MYYEKIQNGKGDGKTSPYTCVVTVDLTEKVTAEERFERKVGETYVISGGRLLQAEGISSPEVERVQCAARTAREPVHREWSEQGVRGWEVRWR